MNVSKAEQAQRRTALLQALTCGQTYAQIKAQLAVSEKTLSRDLRVINSQLEQWAAEQQNRALGLAIAQYQRVIDQAWADHDADARNEQLWLAGEFASEVQVPDPVEGARVERKTQQQFRSQKADYLRVIVAATEKLCKLAGLERAEVVQQNNLVQLSVRVVYDDQDSASGTAVAGNRPALATSAPGTAADHQPGTP